MGAHPTQKQACRVPTQSPHRLTSLPCPPPCNKHTNTAAARDPRQRPSARAALQHKWLAGDVTQRHAAGAAGGPNGGAGQLGAVVARLQRYNQQHAFKRTILDMMANELLRRHVARLEEEDAAAMAAAGVGSDEPEGSLRGGGGVAGGSLRGGVGGSLRGGVGGSLRGGVGGSLRGGAGGSLRGSMTALEALRRARERRGQQHMEPVAKGGGGGGAAAAASAGTGSGAPQPPLASAAADGDIDGEKAQAQAPAPRGAGAALSAAGAAVGPRERRVVALDPSSLTWDMQFMAQRLAREGSAHGNQHAAK